jgi:hypothetical protein
MSHENITTCNQNSCTLTSDQPTAAPNTPPLHPTPQRTSRHQPADDQPADHVEMRFAPGDQFAGEHGLVILEPDQHRDDLPGEQPNVNGFG